MADRRTPPPPPHPPEGTAPPAPQTPVQRSEPAAQARQVENLELKAIMLLVFTLVLLIGSALFLLKARGFFEPTQELVLIADNAEGMAAGMDLTFSGFPIGTVEKFSLGEDGAVRVEVAVREKEARWLRTSSIFTLEKPLLGAPQLRAFSGILTDPPLPPGAERPLLRGDANEQIQQVVGAARGVLDNLQQMTASSSELNRAMANLQVFTQKLQSRQGALHAIMGNEADARKLVIAIERANRALARVDALLRSADRMVRDADRLVVNADREVFGPQGLSRDARAAASQLRGLLEDARGSLRRVDAVIQDVQGIGGDVKGATSSLGQMRESVESNLRKIEDLINELNRKWPFAKDREVQLP